MKNDCAMRLRDVIFHPKRTQRRVENLEAVLSAKESTITTLEEDLRLLKDYAGRVELQKNDLQSRLWEEERKGTASLGSVKQLSIELMKVRRKADEVNGLRTANKKLTERLERSEKARSELQKRVRVLEETGSRGARHLASGRDIDFESGGDLFEGDSEKDWFETLD